MERLIDLNEEIEDSYLDKLLNFRFKDKNDQRHKMYVNNFFNLTQKKQNYVLFIKAKGKMLEQLDTNENIEYWFEGEGIWNFERLNDDNIHSKRNTFTSGLTAG